jgi:hypothetical protein
LDRFIFFINNKREGKIMSQVHVRYEGQSIDMTFESLDIGDLSSDGDVRSAVAEALDAPVTKLAAYTVDRNTESGEITLRPQARFG